MVINSALSVEQTITPNFFGSDVTRYNQSTSITVKNAVIDPSNYEGVSAGIKAFLLESTNGAATQLIVGGRSFGLSQLSSFSSSSSDMVNYGELDLTFEMIGKGDYQPLGGEGANYASIAANTAIFYYADSVSETWQYSRSANSFVVTHTISIQQSNQTGGGGGTLASPLRAASNVTLAVGIDTPAQGNVGTPAQRVGQTFAQRIMKMQGQKPWFEMGLDSMGGELAGVSIDNLKDSWKRTTSSTQDLIQGSSSYTETFTSTNPGLDSADDNAATRSLTFNRGAKWVYVSEKGAVESMGNNQGTTNNNNPAKEGAAAYVNGLLEGSDTAGRDRVVAFFNELKNGKDKDLIKDCDGNPKIIRTTLTTSSLSPSIEYELTLTNDIQYSGCSGATVTQSQGTSLVNCYLSNDLQVEYKGLGPRYSGGKYVAYEGAKKKYKEEKEDFLAEGAALGLSDKPISEDLNTNRLAGTVVYKTAYSNDPIFDEQDEGYKQYSTSTNIRHSYDSKNYFNVLNLWELAGEDVIAQGGINYPTITSYSLTLIGDGRLKGQIMGRLGTEFDPFFEKAIEDAKVYFDGKTAACYWKKATYNYSIDPAPALTITMEAV